MASALIVSRVPDYAGIMGYDPKLVAVTPARGTRVKLTAKREGRSTLKVRSSGVSLVLLIETTHKDGSTWAHITPVTVPPRKP